jgi:NAD(P)-dependent dehydrogenase (short-subunit alcohol dehydrogenase family)
MTGIVNNAGIDTSNQPVGQIIQDDIESTFATNVFGLIGLTQLFVPSKQHSWST